MMRTLERFRLVRSTAVMVLLPREVAMAPYSMDLRERVVQGVGCERRCGRRRGDIRGEPGVGPPIGAASA